MTSKNVAVERNSPSKLPDGWQMVRLGDVVEKREETERNPEAAGFERFLKVEHLDADSLKIKRWGLIKEDGLPPTFYKVFRKGQVLYPTRNPHLRRTAYADFDGICGEKTLTLQAKEKYLIPNLLPFIFQCEAFIQHASISMIGSTNPHVRWKDIAAYEFALPPKNEQRRIAEIISAADEAIGKFKNVIAYAEISKDCSITNILTQNYKLNYTLTSGSLESNHKWPIRKLSEVCLQITDGTHFTPKYTDTGIPFLRVTDIQTSSIDFAGVKYISIEEHEMLIKRCYPQKGDVLLSKNGTIGITKVVDWEQPFSVFVSLCLLKPRKEIDPYYLCEVIRSKFVQSQFNCRAKQGTVKNLHLKEIKDCLIPVPSITEQQEIVSIAKSFYTCHNASINHLNKLQEIKSNLLSQLIYKDR